MRPSALFVTFQKNLPNIKPDSFNSCPINQEVPRKYLEEIV